MKIEVKFRDGAIWQKVMPGHVFDPHERYEVIINDKSYSISNVVMPFHWDYFVDEKSLAYFLGYAGWAVPSEVSKIPEFQEGRNDYLADRALEYNARKF
jgi:hypothetical protein